MTPEEILASPNLDDLIREVERQIGTCEVRGTSIREIVLVTLAQLQLGDVSRPDKHTDAVLMR